MDAYINFVQDRSGSMRGVWDATVDGLNEFVGKQAAEPGEAWLTLTCFDDQIELPIGAAVPIKQVPEFRADGPVQPRGMTALYDAIGRTVGETEKWLSEHPDFNGKVITVVQTDGRENASKELDGPSVKALVEKKKAAGWEFLFLGAGLAAAAQAADVGVAPDMAMAYAGTDEGSRRAYATSSRSVSSLRGGNREAAAAALREDDAPDQ